MNAENSNAQAAEQSQNSGTASTIQDPDITQGGQPQCQAEPVAVQEMPVLPSAPIITKGWKTTPRWQVLALVALVIAGFTGWKIYQSGQPSLTSEIVEPSAAPARLPVRVVPALRTLAQGWVFDEGTSLPVQLRILNFYASGNITHVAKPNGLPLKEGDFVSQGQRLAAIDDRRQTSTIDTAQADVQVAINRRKQAEAAVAKAQINLEKAGSDLNLAKTEHQRYKGLFDQGAVAAIDLDVYRNRIDQAQAAFRIAEQDVRAAEDDVRVAESSIAAAQAQKNQVSVDLEDTQLVSPINGVVAYINIAEGEYWNTQYLDTSAPQALIETAPIVVVDPSSYEVELEIQAEDANAIRLGQRAFVVLEETLGAAQASGASRQDLLELAQARGSQGSVFAISPSQTPGSRGTKVTIRDFLQVSNLKVGARVYVWIETVANEDAIVVPLGAVLARGQDFYVFVADEATGTVERRQVKRGVESLSGIEILSGVQANDLVVVEGQNRLVDGTPVEIVNQPASQQRFVSQGAL